MRATSAASWESLAGRMVELHHETPWMVGDWLHDAIRFGLEDRRNEMIKADHRWEGRSTGELVFVAARFRPSQRRHKVSWEVYSACSKLPDHVADRILAQAAEHRWSLTMVKREASTAARELKSNGA